MSRIALIGKSTTKYISLLIDIWNSGDCAVLIDWQAPFRTATEMMCGLNAPSMSFMKLKSCVFP